jgi:hypothetical protein
VPDISTTLLGIVEALVREEHTANAAFKMVTLFGISGVLVKALQP